MTMGRAWPCKLQLYNLHAVPGDGSAYTRSGSPGHAAPARQHAQLIHRLRPTVPVPVPVPACRCRYRTGLALAHRHRAGRCTDHSTLKGTPLGTCDILGHGADTNTKRPANLKTHHILAVGFGSLVEHIN